MSQSYSREELELLSYDELRKLSAELELEGAQIKRTRHLFIEQFWQRMNRRPVEAVELKEGELAATRIDEQQIVFAKAKGKIYAFSDRCPHKGFPLHKGKLEGAVLTCAYHGGKFDVQSGKCLKHPYETSPCRRFTVTVRDDGRVECK
jgi:nitrite reductase/ring-hydroxylating ferredoxin subunit